MMLKTSNNEFIEVDDVDIEKQCKLFQNISDTAGDFSYEFQIDNNSEVRSKLGIPSAINQLNKTIYQINDISLLSDDGSVLFVGYLRVSAVNRDFITVSFFSGNNNWFNEMTGDLKDIDWTAYDVELSPTSVINSWDNTNGIVFPILNSGTLDKRNTPNFKLYEFPPFIYVKDVIKECFKYSELKLAGDILTDYRYTRMITSTNRDSVSDRIEARKIKVRLAADQTITTGAYQIIEFDVEDEVGDLGLWDNVNFRYTADVNMEIEITLTITTVTGGGGADIINGIIAKNGDEVNFVNGFSRGDSGTLTNNFPIKVVGVVNPIILLAGDYIDFRAKTIPTGTIDITSATLTITPTKLNNIFTEGILPEKKQLDFVLDIFKLFNPVIDYNSFTKTVTVDFFKNIIREDEIDISEYIDPETVEVDYTELINDYAKVNNLTYSEASNRLIDKYNSGRIYTYGSGQIESGNQFVDTTKDILSSSFVATPEDVRNPFGVSLPHIEFTEADGGTEFEATIVDDSGAKITAPTDFRAAVGDLVEITSSDDDDSYIGQWSIVTIISALEFRVTGMRYTVDADITIRKVEIKSVNNTDQVILLGEPTVPWASFTDYQDITIDTTNTAADPFYVWFYKPETGFSAVDAFLSSLSFGDNDIPLAYQFGLMEDFWADLGPIIRDPVKVYVKAFLPKSVFDSLNFKTPVRVKTEDFNSRFILNRNTGYKGSEKPCTLELIKIP